MKVGVSNVGRCTPHCIASLKEGSLRILLLGENKDEAKVEDDDDETGDFHGEGAEGVLRWMELSLYSVRKIMLP